MLNHKLHTAALAMQAKLDRIGTGAEARLLNFACGSEMVVNVERTRNGECQQVSATVSLDAAGRVIWKVNGEQCAADQVPSYVCYCFKHLDNKQTVRESLHRLAYEVMCDCIVDAVVGSDNILRVIYHHDNGEHTTITVTPKRIVGAQVIFSVDGERAQGEADAFNQIESIYHTIKD